MVYFSFVSLNQAFSYNLNMGSRQWLNANRGSKEETENFFNCFNSSDWNFVGKLSVNLESLTEPQLSLNSHSV